VRPECAAGFSARRDRKNDVDVMSNCQPRSRRNAVSNARGSGDARLSGLAQGIIAGARWPERLGFQLKIATAAGAPQKNNNPVN
jgi:hypothetical protein